MPLATMEGQDKEHPNTLRLEIPSNSVVIESFPRLNLMPEIIYSEEQHVPSLLQLFRQQASSLLKRHVTERNSLVFHGRQTSDYLLCWLLVPEQARAAR